VRYHRTTGEEEGGGEKLAATPKRGRRGRIASTARPTPPEPPLRRIASPVIVQGLQDESPQDRMRA